MPPRVAGFPSVPISCFKGPGDNENNISEWQKHICLSSYVCTILCNNNVELPYCFRKTFAVTPSVVAVVSWRLGLRPATGKGKLPKT